MARLRKLLLFGYEDHQQLLLRTHVLDRLVQEGLIEEYTFLSDFSLLGTVDFTTTAVCIHYRGYKDDFRKVAESRERANRAIIILLTIEPEWAAEEWREAVGTWPVLDDWDPHSYIIPLKIRYQEEQILGHVYQKLMAALNSPVHSI